jgi:riboflavin kinase/FMN adenylyltransferase
LFKPKFNAGVAAIFRPAKSGFMLLIEDLSQIKKPFADAVITIGNFDGVHIGHQALFNTVIERAKSRAGTAIAMTFEPHPLRVVKKNNPPPLITPYEQKVELISKTGLDVLISVPFDEQFASIGPRDFVTDILIGKIGTKVLVVGPDYSFGKARSGDVNFLKKMAAELSFEVFVLPWIAAVGPDGERISSTRIRELVLAGALGPAKTLLGRDYQVRGTVVKGRNRGGATLGFPTANLLLKDELCPASGVYAVTVELDGQTLPAVANIGYSPTFGDNQFTVEVHLLDFSGNLYGQTIRVNFIARLRGEIKFDGIEALKAQIGRDIEQAHLILK